MYWKTAAASLRELIWELDPIGLADFVPDDEYDSMLLPLLGRLNAGADQSEIRDFLCHEMGHHFGIPLPAQGADPFAERIMEWWDRIGHVERER